MKNSFSRLLVALTIICLSGSALATEYGGTVKSVGIYSDFPARFYFHVNGQPCNGNIYENSNTDAVKGLYATVMAAWLSGRKLFVTYEGLNGNGWCKATSFWAE